VIADAGPRMAALLAQLLKKSRRKRALGRVPDAFIARVREQLEDPSHVPRPGQSESLLEPLSTREVEVLALLAQGASNDEIGRRLHVAVSTVKRHVYNIFGKLGVKNRTQATARARELRLIS